jgi:hypothetical protein
LPLQRLCKDGPWFGRQAESSELLALWEAAAETRLVLVRGESGIGKSRLVAEFAAEIHRRGGAVAFGTCVDGPQLPFEPFVAGLSSAGMTVDDDPALRRLVAPRIADMHDVVDPERSRLALEAALFDAMVCIARPAGLLLIVEDLHWASESTREVLEMIARTPRRGRLLVIATTRDEGVAPDQYGAYLGRLDRSPSVTTLPLGGLDLNAATQLIDSAGSSLDPADGVARSGGNPLFLRQLARHGATSRSLGEAVAERFMRLNGDELDIADIAVACGPDRDRRRRHSVGTQPRRRPRRPRTRRSPRDHARRRPPSHLRVHPRRLPVRPLRSAVGESAAATARRDRRCAGSLEPP